MPLSDLARVTVMRPLTTIAFDADDTLWHNERFFQDSQQRFAELLDAFADAEKVRTGIDRRRTQKHRILRLRRKGLHPVHAGNGDNACRRRPSGFSSARDPVSRQDDARTPVEILPGVIDALETLKDTIR
jgi:putative hydrolase of the HAD superfamily